MARLGARFEILARVAGEGRRWIGPAGNRLIRGNARWRECEKVYGQVAAAWANDPPTVSVNRSAFEGEQPEVSIRRAEAATGDLLPELNNLASEAVHHLRTCLEYVAFALAWHDSGEAQEDTQFPIREDATRWSRVVRSDLPGVSPKHRALVRTYQPFAGCEWTGPLRDLSNADKHRELITLSPTFGYTFNLRDTIGPDPNDANRLLVRITEYSISLNLLGGPGVMEVFRPIMDGAFELINRLAKEFREPGLQQGTGADAPT